MLKFPFKKKQEFAVILETFEELDINTKFKIREIDHLEDIPSDKSYFEFLERLASYYCLDSIIFLKRIRKFLDNKELEVEEIIGDIKYIPEALNSSTQLTKDQTYIVNEITKFIYNPEYKANLIHGVTGSGKTEIYKKLILETIKNKKSVILMLPEVSLATQFEKLLKKQLEGLVEIFGFHSATSVSHKKELWSKLLHKTPILIVGVHLPVLLPISNLGLIIIDEEHDVGYQEKKHPKINSKEAAILRASYNKIPIVLGSATPSISSIYNIKNKNWNLFELKKRFSGQFPKVEIVNLKEDKKNKNFWISQKLEDAIGSQLEKKEQTIVFINRRGYSFFVQCKCSSCSVSLTLHGYEKLICHYCGFNKILPQNCDSCKKDSKNFLKKGLGTQQVTDILQALYPEAKIARADVDSTVDRKKWAETIKNFEEGHIDILVGTQTVTKGYHFPKVTLVGVIWADVNLNFPVYNCAEITLQQLIQVAGRAGRQSENSKVIIQTLINHKIYDFINEADYMKFYDFEIEKRKMVEYPPIIRLAEIELKNTDEQKIESDSENLANFLNDIIERENLPVTLLGPALPPVAMIKKTHARKIYLKCNNINILQKLYKIIDYKNYSSSIFFTPNPISH